MYATTKKLKITCPTNPDYNTVFDKKDIEEELQELDIVGNWIEYVLDHLFSDESEFTSTLIDVVNFANVRKVTYQFGDDLVTIEKIK